MSELVDKLAAEGWTKQFTASGLRLAEALENYRQLGFEVRTVPIRELGCGDCTICFDDENDASVMIFTRKTGAPEPDELYDDDNG